MLNKAKDDDLVMSLVDLALTRPADQREAYLRTACGGDTELFDQTWTYVQWEERMNGFLLDPLYPPASDEHPFEPGEMLDGRFRIVREIAQGGMGIVYEAVDEKLQRHIALKCAKTGFRKRLPPEVRNATAISHPNVCKIFEIHTAATTQGEIDFITMELLDGETLAERLKRGPLPENEARAIARQLCAGLAEAHHNHVIHGDLKNNNVILTTGPNGALRAVITDFGLAHRPEAAQGTVSSARMAGTPNYMAPELLKGGKASVASDIYALGVLLSQLNLGRLQNRVVARCLYEDPVRRFQKADEVAHALVPLHSRRWVLAVAAVVLAAVTGVVTYQRATAPQEKLRLAILPFETDANAGPISEGLLLDTSDRLSHVKAGPKRRLTLIPLADALQNKVYQPAKARTMLGATHTLNGALRTGPGRVEIVAYLTDASSLVHLKEWRAEYSTGELRNMPTALAGMVTETLDLPPLAMAATVNAAAYSDYSAGVALARRDPDVDRALPLLESAVKADPNSPLTHAKLAETQWTKYQLTKDLQWQEKALASLKNAEQRNPDVAAVRLLSGMIHESFGQYEQAREDLLRAIELEPNNGDAWRRLGKVYEDSNQPNKALSAYQKAIDVQPDYFKNYEQLGYFFFRRGEYEDALQQRKRVAELVPDLADAHYQLAAPYLNLGRYSDAERELNIALSYQETANAVEGLGLTRVYQERYSEAIPFFERAIKIGPPTSLYYINLGSACRRSNLAPEAQQAYRKGLDLAEAALAQNPNDGYEKSCLAYLCAQLGDRRRSESEAKQALQLSAGATNVRWMVVQTYEALGERNQTIEVLRNAPASMLDRLSRFPELADLRADSRFQQLLTSNQVH
jgi:tetratricopeptide (TPR) repeat protein